MSRRAIRLLVTVVAVSCLAPLVGSFVAVGQEATPPPNTFGLRLEGFAVEKNTFSTATAVTPRTAYSYAKISSFLDLDGGRGLDMEARGANDQYAGLAGAALFGGDVPTDGNNLPGYTQAFFPTFEGFSQISEKCAVNQTEAREAPECRDQSGPYALSRVVPDQDFPTAVGIGRNQGEGDGRGDARSSSRIEPQADGTIVGVQFNSGSDQGVPGTPIMVESYVARQTVTTSLEGSSVDIACEGEVTVGGQPVNDNEQLQQLLAPLTVASDLRVEFEPPSEPTVQQLPGGALEATCRGPRFTVFTSGQGGTGTTYTFGKTFAAVGATDNRESSLPVPGGGGSTPPPDPRSPAPEPAPTADPTPTPSSGPGGSPSSSGPAAVPAPSTTVPTTDVDRQETASTPLERVPVDTVPIGLLTGVAAGLLPLAVWLLLGVTGSLARGLPSLRLPPFRS